VFNIPGKGVGEAAKRIASAASSTMGKKMNLKMQMLKNKIAPMKKRRMPMPAGPSKNPLEKMESMPMKKMPMKNMPEKKLAPVKY